MTASSVEQKIRAGLPFIRMMQAYAPLPLMVWLLKLGNARVKLPPDITRKPVSADGVACDWLIPDNAASDSVLLYLHGGGFVFPQTPPHLKMGAYLARKTGLQTLMVDYRVAPAHPFPAALDDCVTAYRWLLKQGFAAHNIVIAGDSAGGNLTITTLMTLRDSGDALPAAAACLSPVADFTKRDDDKRADPLLHPKARKMYRQSYVGHSDPSNPLLSPVLGDWRGLPPLLIHAGEDEVLREDAVQIEKLASAAGVDVQLEIFPAMWHVWQINLAFSFGEKNGELYQLANSLRKLHLLCESAPFICFIFPN